MNSRKLQPSDFEGKTITKAEVLGINCLHLFFSDGTSISVEVEAILPSLGLHGMVAYPVSDDLPADFSI